MEIELFDSPVFKKIKKEYVAYFRKLYDAAEVVWKYTENKHKFFRKSTKFKEAIEVAKNNGIDLQLFHQDNIADLGYSDLRQKVFQKLRLAGNKEAEQKLRVLYYERDFLPLEHFTGIFDTLYLTQHWEFTEKPSNNEFFPVWLQTANHVYDYKPKIKSGEDMEWTEEGDWLEENFFTNPRGMIRAVVYTEDREYEYNFQDIPAAKKLLNIILETSIKWGEAARATDFDFDVVSDGVQWNEDCLQTAWKAAPEELRNEHIKAVRQLVKEVWKYHEKQQTTHYTGNQSKTFFPSETISPNDKITNTLFDGELKLGECAMIAHTKTPKKSSIEPIMSKVEINYKAIEDCVSLVQQDWDAFTDYDRSIYNACVSLYLIGNKFVTPQTIYRAYCGKQTAMATPKNIERIINSIEKLRSTNIKINADDVVHSYNKNIKKWEIDTTLLEARRHNALSIHGKSASGYELLAAPPLFVFADAIGQVIRTPISIQATPVTKTEDAVKMQEYLKNRIAAMGGGKVKRVIRYKSIFDKIEWMGETEGSIRNKKAKIREQVRSILDYWVQENYIARYAENRHGKEFYSIEIFLPLSKAN